MRYHDVHHATNVDKLNAVLGSQALSDNIVLKNLSLTSLIMHIGTKTIANLTEKQEIQLRNNAGGHWNHAFYWRLMAANGSSAHLAKISTVHLQ